MFPGKKLVLVGLVCIAVWCLVPPAAQGQTGQGNIVGSVTDATGAAIAGVTVRATNPQTGFSYNSVTNDEGIYRILYVNPATYELNYEMQGFKKLTRSNILVRSTETARVDVSLEIGSLVESIEVKAEAALLETESATTGHLATGDVINQLPTPQQKMHNIPWYMPGVEAQKGEGHGSGQRSRSFVISMDGVSAMDPVRGSISTDTTLYTAEENIGEVKVLTTALPAEYGHSGGAIMNVAFKGGTNQLHGLAEERYMSKGMLHRQWEEPNISKGSFGYHLISGSISGPVVLPKIYNGRNKTFFLAGFQRQHSKESFSRIATVPSSSMLAGDFSFGGKGDPIYDPGTLTRLANGNYSRDKFPDNRIPLSRFDSSINKFLGMNPWNPQYDPLNQSYIDSTGPHNNLNYDSRKRSYRTGIDLKIDHSFTDSHKIFGRYSNLRNRAWPYDYLQGPFANPLFDYDTTAVPNDYRQVVVSDSLMINPTTINEIRVGANRRHSTRSPESSGKNLAGQLGIPNVGPQTMPSFLDSNGSNLFNARFPEGATSDVTEGFNLQENLTLVRGEHTFKTGYELLRTRANSLLNAMPSGSYRFGGTEFPFTPNTGNAFASFLMGGVTQATFTKDQATWLPRWWTNSLYFQDDWKLSRKITLNLGVRWQYETPFQTKYGQQSQFSPTAIDPLTGLPGAILHPTGPLAKRDSNNFQPRLGMAYNFKKNWVFRSGFAVNTLDVWTNGLQENFDEYLATAVVQPPAGNPDVAFYLSQGPPPIKFNILPNGSSPYVGTNYSGRNASYYDPNMHSPYVMNWNAGFQWQFASNMLVELSYQGSAGVGLLNRWDINAIPLNIANNFNDLDRIRRAAQNYKPYPQFGSIYSYSNYGHNTYHSGTLRFEKRFSHGMTLTSFYTHSKAIDESSTDGAASGVTFYNRGLEKGRADYDVPNRWVTYTTYALPVGRGHRFLGNSNWLLNGVLGNWNLSVIQTLETGAPFSFSVAGSSNVWLPGTVRPDMAPGKTYDDIQISWDRHGPCRFNAACALPWADINAFAYPASFSPGQSGRNIVNGPGLIWHQGSLSKQFPIRERLKGTVRADINNLFKRPFFAVPNSAVNFRNPQAFGKITATQGSYSNLGGRTFIEVIFKLEF